MSDVCERSVAVAPQTSASLSLFSTSERIGMSDLRLDTVILQEGATFLKVLVTHASRRLRLTRPRPNVSPARDELLYDLSWKLVKVCYPSPLQG